MRDWQGNELFFCVGLIHLSSYIGLVQQDRRDVALVNNFLVWIRRLQLYLALLWAFMLDQGLGLDHVQYHELAVVRMGREYITVSIIQYGL